MTAAVISHGSLEDLEFHRKVLQTCDLVICADGGAYHADRMGIEPQVIVGDFDSCDESFLQRFKNAEIIKYPSNKDKTDTELAVDYAAGKGHSHIILLGSTGSRLDHTLANIGLLKAMLDRGIWGEIINHKNRIFLIKDSIEVEGKGNFISLLPCSGDVTGITLRGFKYPLKDFTLRCGDSRCISNELLEEKGYIKISSGLLLVIIARD